MHFNCRGIVPGKLHNMCSLNKISAKELPRMCHALKYDSRIEHTMKYALVYFLVALIFKADTVHPFTQRLEICLRRQTYSII